MEENKNKKISLSSIIFILIILILIAIIVYLLLTNTQTINNTTLGASHSLSTETTDINTIISEKDNTIEQLEKEISEFKNTISGSQSSDSTNNSYQIGTIKNLSDAFSDNDAQSVKAQKIAQEVMNAVNNKDWYYLAKMVGTDADSFINYGIYNYKIDTNKYDKHDNKYVFTETYDWDKSKLSSPNDISLGHALVIEFDENGRILIDTNCTGI